jgi:trigger factor
VKQIRSRQPAEMNAAFFNAVGVASEQELRERVRASLQAVGEYAERQRLRGEVLQWLSARTELKDLPASLVAEETGRILREVVRENVQRGVQQEELESHKEELFNHAVQSSSERVKLDFILYRIAGAEKIEVTDEELAAEIERLAQRYGLAPAKLRAGLEKRGALEGLRDDLRAEKTITFLVALAQPPAEAA